MLQVENPASVKGKGSHSSLSGRDVEEDKKVPSQLQLRLLAKPTKELPKWMKCYRVASYTIYSIVALHSIVYLIYIGVVQANIRFQIQYYVIVGFLEYNSYSILSPLLCPILMYMLIYQVRKRIMLDEGDFFGILGILLFLSLVSIHDMWGIFKLLHFRRDTEDTKTQTLIPPLRDDTSRDFLHWQYAWTTRTICSKKYVRALMYRHEYSKKHLVRQIIFRNSDVISRIRRDVNSSQPPPPPTTLAPLPPLTPLTPLPPPAPAEEMDCNLYQNAKSKAKIRDWMRDIQNEYRCCGPYGYEKWKEWFAQDSSTGCKPEWIIKETGDIPSCFDPLMSWMESILTDTFWLMLILAIGYLICMILLGIHHSAMKLEHEKIEKRYSLLSLVHTSKTDLTPWWTQPRPPDQTMIVGQYPSTTETGNEQDPENQNRTPNRNHSKSKIDDTSEDRLPGKASKKKKKSSKAS